MGRIKRYRTALSRHHRSKGHGIHSPFAFNFVRFVLREKSPYYSYDSMKELRQTVINTLRGVKNHPRVISFKGMKMLFRITNFFNPMRILQVGSCYGMTAATMLEVSSRSTLCLYEPHLDAYPVLGNVLMPYLDRLDCYNDLSVALDDYCHKLGTGEIPFVMVNMVPRSLEGERLSSWLSQLLKNECVIVIRNISRSDSVKDLWKDLKSTMTHGQSFTNEKTAVIVSMKKFNLEHFFLWF